MSHFKYLKGGWSYFVSASSSIALVISYLNIFFPFFIKGTLHMFDISPIFDISSKKGMSEHLKGLGVIKNSTCFSLSFPFALHLYFVKLKGTLHFINNLGSKDSLDPSE